MAAGVELVGLHLVVAGAAVAGDAADVRRALEHLDVVHDGLVAAGDHRLVLRGREGVGISVRNTGGSWGVGP